MELQGKNDSRKVLHRRLSLLRIGGSSFGCFGAIAIVGLISQMSGNLLLVPSFGASSVIIATIPDSAFAQPRSVVFGHFISSLAGLLCLMMFGQIWWGVALAVGVSVALMQLTRTLHPPAAADPLLFMQGGMGWHTLFSTVLAGSIVLVLYFYLFNNWIARRPYPKYWL